MKKTLSILFTLALVLSFSLVATTPVAAATTYYVATTGDDTSGTGTESSPWATIQHAVDSVVAGDTIIVAAGTYVEQVSIIDKSITLQGVGVSKPVIQAPAAASRTTHQIPVDESPSTFDPIIFIHGVTAASDVTVDYFEIDGLNDPGSHRFTGILARNVFPGVISNNHLHSLMGAQETMGIMVYGAESDVTISDNYVTGFSRNGITANADAYADVVGNTVVGRGYTDAWAQNGIQIGFGATGTIVGNSVSDIGWIWDGSSTAYTASGILGCHASGTLVVESNDFTNVQVPILTQDTNLIASANEIELTDIGGLIYAYGMLVWGLGADVSVAAVDNSFVDSTGTDTAYGVYFYCVAGHMSVSFHGNLVQGWRGGVTAGGPGTVTADMNWNSIAENSSYGLWNATGVPVDATHNWWGDASGPSGEGFGSGDGVSANVDFMPWLVEEDGAETTATNTDFGVAASASTAAVSAAATGGNTDTTVTVGEYVGNPTSVNPGFVGGALFFDVHVGGPAPLPTELVVEFDCGGECSGMVLRWFDGTAWQDVSPPVSYTNGTIVATLSGTSSPTIAQLTGTPFGLGGPLVPLTLPDYVVGWDGSPISQVAVLAPWIALLAIMASAGLLVLRRRRAQI